MKKAVLFLMVILVCSPAAFAQLIDQQSNLPVGMWVLELVPVNDQVVWGTGRAYSSVENTTWVCRTVDGGTTWSAVAALEPTPYTVYVSNITAVSADVAWIAVSCDPAQGENRIYKTIDGGQTWSRQSNGLEGIKEWLNIVWFFDASDGLAVFNPDSTGYSGHFYTRDGGESWTRVAPADDVPMLPGEYSIFGNFCVAGEALFWATNSSPVPSGPSGRLLRTMDRGKSWSVTQTPYGSLGYIYVAQGFKDALNGMVTGLDANSWITGISVTHDGGATWQPFQLPSSQFVTVRYIPGTESGYMAAGDEGTAFTLDDGATWTWIDDQPTSMMGFASQTIGWTGVWASQTIRKWQIDQPPLIGCYPVTMMDFGRLLPGQESEPQSLSLTNYGQDPLVITEIIPPGSAFKLYDPFPLPRTLQFLETARINITFNPIAGGVVNDSVVFVSNAPLAPRRVIRLQGEGVVIEPAQPERLYAVTAKSLYTVDPASGAASKVADMTLTKATNLIIQPGTQELLGISASSTGTEIYRISSASGIAMLLQTIPALSIRSFAFKADTLFGATLAGELYRINLETGIATLVGTAPKIKYYGLTVHPATGELYASALGATKDLIVKINPANGDTTLVGAIGDNTVTPVLNFSPAGVLYGFKGTTATTLITIDPVTGKGTTIGPTGVTSMLGLACSPRSVGVEQQNSAGEPVQTFALRQNYPNPFNAQTCVEVTAPKPERVEVQVFNLLGKRVATLHQGMLQAGKHRLIWVGNDEAGRQAPAGVYVIRMTAPGFSASRKVLLLR